MSTRTICGMQGEWARVVDADMRAHINKSTHWEVVGQGALGTVLRGRGMRPSRSEGRKWVSESWECVQRIIELGGRKEWIAGPHLQGRVKFERSMRTVLPSLDCGLGRAFLAARGETTTTTTTPGSVAKHGKGSPFKIPRHQRLVRGVLD